MPWPHVLYILFVQRHFLVLCVQRHFLVLCDLMFERFYLGGYRESCTDSFCYLSVLFICQYCFYCKILVQNSVPTPPESLHVPTRIHVAKRMKPQWDVSEVLRRCVLSDMSTARPCWEACMTYQSIGTQLSNRTVIILKDQKSVLFKEL
jgi:hypothetical protein